MVTKDISGDCKLGRSIASDSSARKARRGIFRHRDFRLDEGGVSFDRLCDSWIDEVASIADKRDRMRGRNFRGWAVVKAEIASQDGGDA